MFSLSSHFSSLNIWFNQVQVIYTSEQNKLQLCRHDLLSKYLSFDIFDFGKLDIRIIVLEEIEEVNIAGSQEPDKVLIIF